MSKDEDLREMDHAANDAHGKFLDDLKKRTTQTTQVGLLRKAMMYSDIDKYFKEAWQQSWNTMTTSSLALMNHKWGHKKIASIRRAFLDEKKD